jgi:hypothetical protein
MEPPSETGRKPKGKSKEKTLRKNRAVKNPKGNPRRKS